MPLEDATFISELRRMRLLVTSNPADNHLLTILQEHTRSTHTDHIIRHVVCKTHIEWLTSTVCREAQEKQIYQNRVTLQTRSQKRNLRHSHTQSHYLRPPQHSQSHITRHNSSPKIFKPHSNPRSRSISNTSHIQWKSHIQNYSKHRYTRAVLGHKPRFAPRRVLFMHAHHPPLLCQSFVPAQLQALSRLPQDKELRTPPSLGTNRLSGSFDRAPLKSARSLRPRPLGLHCACATQSVLPKLPTTPARGPLGPEAVYWPELSRPLFH